MTSTNDNITSHLNAARLVSETEKSSANMNRGTMDVYRRQGRKIPKPVAANRYCALILPSAGNKTYVKESPEEWVFDTVLADKPDSSKIEMTGERLFPEYSIPVRFLDAHFSENLTLGSLKLLHFVFATCTWQGGESFSREVRIRKRALAGYLASSKSSLSTSFTKESIAVLETLEARIGIRKLLNKRSKVETVKIFENIKATEDFYVFTPTKKVENEFERPKLYAPVGLNVIKEFKSLHSLLLFSAMLGESFVSYSKHTSRLRAAKAENKMAKLKASLEETDPKYLHVGDWRPDWMEMKLDDLGYLIGLPDGTQHAQRKRVQKRVIDAADKMKKIFGDGTVGPLVSIHEDFDASTLKDRKNEATLSGKMKLAIRAPFRPAQYLYKEKEIVELYELSTTTDLYVGSQEFMNALALAGFNFRNPELATMVHTDWQAFLWKNKDRVDDGEPVDHLFEEYHAQLRIKGFSHEEDIGIARKVGQWWNRINGTLDEHDGLAVIEEDEEPVKSVNIGKAESVNIEESEDIDCRGIPVYYLKAKRSNRTLGSDMFRRDGRVHPEKGVSLWARKGQSNVAGRTVSYYFPVAEDNSALSLMKMMRMAPEDIPPLSLEEMNAVYQMPDFKTPDYLERLIAKWSPRGNRKS